MGERVTAKKRVFVSFSTALAAFAAAILIGLVGGQVTGLPERIQASGDGYALTAEPDAWTGGEHQLVAGGSHGGAAITYLKFDVKLPEDRLPRRAWLWLGVQGGPLPGMVELTQVPDTGWTEADLTANRAPRLGNVVASLSPRPNAAALAFNVSQIIRSSGLYAFAVTAPTSSELARFVAREALRTATGAPTITLEWSRTSDVDIASGSSAEPGITSAPPSSATPPVAPGFTPSPRDPREPPVVHPWPSAPPTITASASYTAGPSPDPEPDPGGPPQPSTPPVDPDPHPDPDPTAGPDPSPTAGPIPSEPTATPSSANPPPSPSAGPRPPHECVVGESLVPTCGALWGVAPGAHTSQDRIQALAAFDQVAGKPQLIFHAYNRGYELFPTQEQIALARDPQQPRILFLNWKPVGATWAEIAGGHRDTDEYLVRLAEHLRRNFPERFFFTVHHEPENDVIAQTGSGMTAKDYAAAFRYVVRKLRAEGVNNLVTTMCYMAYIPWNTKPWFEDLYPGDDVVDWVSWDIYAYSEPGYGFGDFAEMMNRRSGSRTGWPGFYNWAAQSFPDKPLMVAEWGVWYSKRNPRHHADFFDSARLQLELFPRVKAYVYFESPDAEGRDSRVHNTVAGMQSFQQFSAHPAFDVKLPRRQANGREVSPWSHDAPTPRPQRLS